MTLVLQYENAKICNSSKKLPYIPLYIAQVGEHKVECAAILLHGSFLLVRIKR